MSFGLVDKWGNPLPPSEPPPPTMPSMRGDWAPGHSLGSGVTGNIYGIDRNTERRAARISFFLNGLVEGITGLLTSYVVGDEFTYGTLDDKDAQLILEEMWSANNLDALGERIWLEYLIDGESALVFDQDARQSEPAFIGLVDVDGALTLKSNSLDGVTKLELPFDGNTRTFEQGEFVWTANHALWNDPRGWPVLMRAIPAALAYVGLINSRLRVQEIQGRINGVYKAFYYPGSTDADARFDTKVARYSRIPRDGGVLGLAKDPKTGQSEEFDFLQGGKGATDAAQDGRLIRMLAAVALNIPPTWLGDGEDSNRASATRMDGPPLMAMKRRQSTFRSILNRTFRCELKRRKGPDATYLVRYTEPAKADPLTIRKRTKRVRADMLEAPWVLPRLDDDSLEDIVKKVEVMNKQSLGSKQTRQEMLGLDPALEQERMANETPNERITLRTQPPTPPNPDGDQEPPDEQTNEEETDES